MINSIKEILSFLHAKITKYNNVFVVGAVVYFLFVITGIIVLYSGKAEMIMEAQDYGNIATAIIDGITKQTSIENIQNQQWEGSEILLAPFITLFFLIFGENYYVLQKTGVFLSGFWALIWFLVACELFGKKQIWKLAIIFLIATPLIHTHHESVINILGSHWGASILFGLSFLFLLKSRYLKNHRRKIFFLIFSGVMYSLSVFYGNINLLLFPIILILFFKPQLRLSSFKFWILGFLILFSFYYSYMDKGFIIRVIEWSSSNIDISSFLSSFVNFLIYFGAIPGTEFPSPNFVTENPYSILSGFYFLFLSILSLYYFVTNFYKKGKIIKLKNISAEFFALFFGSIFFLVVISLLYTFRGFNFFVIIHYLIPLIPFYLLALCYFFTKTNEKLFFRNAFIIYIGVTILVLFSFIHPFEGKDSQYFEIPGFNAIYIFNSPELAVKINLKDVANERLEIYAFAMGEAYASLPDDFSKKKEEIAIQLSDRLEIVRKKTLEEFVSGYYSRVVFNLRSCEKIKKFLKKNDDELSLIAVQGIKDIITKMNQYGKLDNKCFNEIYKHLLMKYHTN